MEIGDDLYKELEKCARNLMRTARWFDGDRELEPRDLVQDAVVKLLAAERQGLEVLNTAAWLNHAIGNRFRDLTRRQLRRGVSKRNERTDVEVSDDLQDHRHASPESAASFAEWKAAVASAIRSLPERQREVIRLYAQGLGISEITRELGITEGAVRQSLFKARRRLEPYRSGAPARGKKG